VPISNLVHSDVVEVYMVPDVTLLNPGMDALSLVIVATPPPVKFGVMFAGAVIVPNSVVTAYIGGL